MLATMLVMEQVFALSVLQDITAWLKALSLLPATLASGLSKVLLRLPCAPPVMLVSHAPVEVGRSVSPVLTLTKGAAPARSARLVLSVVLVPLHPLLAPMGRTVT
jgi:hypothetical protein